MVQGVGLGAGGGTRCRGWDMVKWWDIAAGHEA